MTVVNHSIDSSESKIYIACLAFRSDGKLFCVSINVNQPAVEIKAAIQRMLQNDILRPERHCTCKPTKGPDTAGSFKPAKTTNHAVQAANILAKYGALGAKVLAYHNDDLVAAEIALTEGYCGGFASKVDFAKKLFARCYEVPEYLMPHVNHKLFAEDLFAASHYALTINGKVHVFVVT